MQIYEMGISIKKLRKEKKMTQESLAKLAGISRVTLGKLERGHFGAVSIVSLDIILSALGYEMDFKTKEGFGIPIFGE